MTAGDDSELTVEDRKFLIEWADNLNESVPVLNGLILVAAIEGDQYYHTPPPHFVPQMKLNE